MKLRKARTSMFLLVTLLLNVLSTFFIAPTAMVMSETPSRQPVDSSTSITDLTKLFQSRYIDPELLESVGQTRVLVIASDSLSSKEMAKYVISGRITPSFKGFYIMVGIIRSEDVKLLALDPRVLAILKDRKVEYSISTDFSIMESPSGENLFLLPLKKRGIGFADETLTGKPDTTLKEVVNVTGAKRAWTDLGIDGANVTIAVVDTGVDYGTLGLGYWDTVARDKTGHPASNAAGWPVLSLATVSQ